MYRRRRRTAPTDRLPPVGERLPREIRVLAVAGFVVALGYGIVAPALPALARSFDVGVTAVSAVVSGFAVVRIAFAPVSGRLLRRLGERPVFCGGLVIVALSSAACAGAAGFAQLLLLRAAGGVGSTMFTVAEAALVIRLAPAGLRGRAAGACGTGFLLGGVAGPVVAGLVVDRAGYAAGFATTAVIALVAFACWLRAPEDQAGIAIRFTEARNRRPDQESCSGTWRGSAVEWM